MIGTTSYACRDRKHKLRTKNGDVIHTFFEDKCGKICAVIETKEETFVVEPDYSFRERRIDNGREFKTYREAINNLTERDCEETEIPWSERNTPYCKRCNEILGGEATDNEMAYSMNNIRIWEEIKCKNCGTLILITQIYELTETRTTEIADGDSVGGLSAVLSLEHDITDREFYKCREIQDICEENRIKKYLPTDEVEVFSYMIREYNKDPLKKVLVMCVGSDYLE